MRVADLGVRGAAAAVVGIGGEFAAELQRSLKDFVAAVAVVAYTNKRHSSYFYVEMHN